MRKNTKSGFTLIELMLVVVIIGILAVLAIPRYLRATAAAKKKESWGVMKQIFVLEEGYYFEHGAYCPSDSPNEIKLIGWKRPSEIMRYEYTVEPGHTGDLTTSMYIVATEIEDTDLDGNHRERIIMDENGLFLGDYDN